MLIGTVGYILDTQLGFVLMVVGPITTLRPFLSIYSTTLILGLAGLFPVFAP
jgi:hypothetical protein